MRRRVAILISGRGSNMAALIEAAREKDFPAEISVVVSNKADAPGVAKAREAGIPVEIVPGITTATAAAAYLGTSLTKRGVARRVQMVTGHDVDGKLPEDLDIAALADPGATTCVFMGKATFAALADKLIARGLSADTPTVVVESLGSPATTVMAGTLQEIAARLSKAKPSGPCMILYGEALAGVAAGKA